MKKCKRCDGEGALNLFASKVEKECWICRGLGELPPVDQEATIRAATVRRGSVKSNEPLLSHKAALSLLHKPGAWGKVPTTIEEARQVWRASVEGRRSLYVWRKLKYIRGLDNRVPSTVDMVGTDRYDPYVHELNSLVLELAYGRTAIKSKPDKKQA